MVPSAFCRKSTIAFGLAGQPCVAAVPASFGQASSLSATPSPSASTLGQPLSTAVPASSGQASSLFATPSLSSSGQGQPSFSLSPATSLHLSFASSTPSASVSSVFSTMICSMVAASHSITTSI